MSIGDAALIAPPQAANWQSVSTAPECATIAPRDVPRMHSWLGPDATKFAPYCDPPMIDDAGNYSAFSLSDLGSYTFFLPSDGSAGATMLSFANDLVVAGFAPRASGFWLLEFEGRPQCNYVQAIGANAGHVGPPMLTQHGDTDTLAAMFRNPRGGYVEALLTNRALTLELRWVDDNLKPIGDWQPVMTPPVELLNDWNVFVDETGKALVLAFLHPRLSAPPNTWQFVGQWMDVSGPMGPAFEPVAPIFKSPSTTLFATWGTVVPMPEGGIAMFVPQANPATGGTISPTGWYAYYPSAQSTPAPAPSWLTRYDGSLRRTGGGAAYAGIERDPATCARTVLLISRSGETCFKLPVEQSEGCDFRDDIYLDGTLVVRNLCPARWWPRLARPAD